MHASPHELQLIISLPCMWALTDVETFNAQLLAFLRQDAGAAPQEPPWLPSFATPSPPPSPPVSSLSLPLAMPTAISPSPSSPSPPLIQPSPLQPVSPPPSPPTSPSPILSPPSLPLPPNSLFSSRQGDPFSFERSSGGTFSPPTQWAEIGGGPPSSPGQDELAGWSRLQGALHDLQLDLDLDASVPPTSTIYFSNATMLSIGASRALRCSLPQSSAASAAATAAGSADSAAGGEGGGAAAGDLVTPAPNRTQTALQLQSAFDAVANSRDVEATGGYTRLGHTSGGSGSGSRVKHLGAPTRD